MPVKRAEREQRQVRVAVEHAHIAGASLQDTWASLADAGAHGLDLVGSPGQHARPPFLLVPAEARDVKAVAKHDAGLGRRGRTGKAAAPRSYGQAQRAQLAGQVGHGPGGDGLTEVVVGKPIDLDDDEPPPLIRADAWPAQFPGHRAVLVRVILVGERADQIDDALCKPRRHR